MTKQEIVKLNPNTIGPIKPMLLLMLNSVSDTDVQKGVKTVELILKILARDDTGLLLLKEWGLTDDAIEKLKS